MENISLLIEHKTLMSYILLFGIVIGAIAICFVDYALIVAGRILSMTFNFYKSLYKSSVGMICLILFYFFLTCFMFFQIIMYNRDLHFIPISMSIPLFVVFFVSLQYHKILRRKFKKLNKTLKVDKK